MNEISEAYEILRKKYKLPAYADLDSEFEVYDCEKQHLLKNILHKTGERIEFYANILNDLLQPEPSSMSNMHEATFIEDSDKERLFSLFKKLMKTHRTIIELMLKNNEQEMAAFVISFFAQWKELKKDLLFFLGEMKLSWDKETKREQRLGYFG